MLYRPDGKQETFSKTNGVWTSAIGPADALTETDNAQGVATSYSVFIGALRQTETYGTNGLLQTVTDESGQGIALTYSTTLTAPAVAPRPGLLLTVTDPEGRQLNFTYTSSGNVHQVTQPDGGMLTYAYDTTGSITNGNLLSVQYPDGKTRQYFYNQAAETGGASLPNALTSIEDEAGATYAFTTYNSGGLATSSYFMSGPSTSVDTTQITYNGNSTSTVQYPLGATATVGFTTANGFSRISSVNQPCGPQCGLPSQALTYDTNGNPKSAEDFNGNITATTYTANGLLNVEVDDAPGSTVTTNQRTITTTWNTTLNVPLQRTVVSNATGATVANTEWIYTATGLPGLPTARCEIDPTNAAASSYTCAATGTVPATGVRRWVYTYCTEVTTNCPIVGLLLSVTGPRTDLTQTTSYSYYTSSATSCGTPGAACYQAGDLETITDPLGHVTTIASYDANGRITRVTDPNGINTDLTYTPRGWLASRTVDGATTTLTYWPYGAVETITDPDGVVTTFKYDTAHRLTDILDAQSNDLHFTLDTAGDKTGETITTASGTVVQSQTRQYNALGQLAAVIDGLKQTVFSASYSDSYDANGNLKHSEDGRFFQRYQNFDALNRLSSTIANYNGTTNPATENTTTSANLDALDRLTGVTDPTALNTIYTYDGLNDRTQLQSPDTGTSTDTYDAAGDRLKHTDANGIVSTSTYDALDRLTSTSYPPGDTAQNVTYNYDQPNTATGCSSSSPTGRLTSIVESTFSTLYCYDGRGNVTQKFYETSTTGGSSLYSYTLANRLTRYSTPDYISGRAPNNTMVTYTYNTNGRISEVHVLPADTTPPPSLAQAITLPPTPTTVVSNIAWLPFGPISSYTLGNGQVVTRTYDLNYRVTDLTGPGLALHFSRDAMGDIQALGNAPGANPAVENYNYDPLYRLGSFSDTGTMLENYTYDQTGDRLSKTTTLGLASGAYLYTPGTHQLASINGVAQANDHDGNTTGSVIGGNTYGYGYNARNRLSLVQLDGQTVGTYTYNALGERVNKVATAPAATQRFAYDEAGHLIGEYGSINRDYIWLGDLPVATVDFIVNGSTPGTISYVTADQLNTPRTVSNSAGTVIWQWAYQANPFGEQQPTTTTGYVLNLRYPGQYFDVETGLMYNGARYYDSTTGRYIESDPKGLAGGQWDTYAYVNGDPLEATDPTGLCLSKRCSNALAAIHKTAQAVERANDNWNTIESAAADSGIDPALLAATGVRESGFQNIDQSGGNGKGVFQIDTGRNPQISAGNAENLSYAANWAAAQLAGNYTYFSQNRPNFTQDQLLQATAAAYNEGRGNVGKTPGTIQKDPHNHYGQNVLDLMDCFAY